jgi:hypothetical protein
MDCLRSRTRLSGHRFQPDICQSPNWCTPQQIEEAMLVSTEARLRALKIGLLIMAGIAQLAIIPTDRLPNYRPGDIPDDAPTGRLKSNWANTTRRGEGPTQGEQQWMRSIVEGRCRVCLAALSLPG